MLAIIFVASFFIYILCLIIEHNALKNEQDFLKLVYLIKSISLIFKHISFNKVKTIVIYYFFSIYLRIIQWHKIC